MAIASAAIPASNFVTASPVETTYHTAVRLERGFGVLPFEAKQTQGSL